MGFTAIVKEDLAPRVDIVSDTITYIGKAVPNSSTSDSVWKIARMTTDANGGIVIEWADGEAKPTKVWDNRASLSYS